MMAAAAAAKDKSIVSVLWSIGQWRTTGRVYGVCLLPISSNKKSNPLGPMGEYLSKA